MSQLGISYEGTDLVFDNFGGVEMPRSYQQSAEFSKSASGASIVNGSPFRQKYMWAMSSIVSEADAQQLDAIFQAWDQDRAQGLPAALGVTDETFGATVTTSAVFSTMPTFSRLGPNVFLASFGLMEV